MAVKECIYRFGNFTLTAGEHSLKLGNHEIHLRPKVYETLLFLIERHGHIVKKEELLNGIWNNVIVTENTLNRCIKELREVLRDNPQQPQYIQTIPRIGFKFIADVNQINPEEQSNKILKVTPLIKKHFRFRNVVVVSSIIPLIIILLLVGSEILNKADTNFGSLAVLPFANMSGDPDQEYFADGMTEALIAELAKSRLARVISRTSTMGYKENLKSLTEIAKELDVDLIVEGSVQRNGNRVLVIVQLINPQTDRHIWVNSYERDMHDILMLQQELARAIVSEIKLELKPSQKNIVYQQLDPETYEAYLKGRYYWNKRTPNGFLKGIEYFERAIERDSNYALAYVGLADCYNMLSNYDVLPPVEAHIKVNSALTHALRINRNLAEAHASLAFVKMFYEWNWAEAENAFKQAIELNPNLADAHHWYGLYLATQQRSDEALAEMKKALSLDPLSIIINTNLGWVLYFARRYNDAVKQFRQSLEFDSTFVSARIKLGWAYEQLSRYEDAVSEFQKSLKLLHNDPALLAILGHTYALSGQEDMALKIIEELKERSQREYITSYLIAVIYTGLGDKELALEWLRKAYRERDGWIAWLKVDPKLNPLREEPEFTELMAQVGF